MRASYLLLSAAVALSACGGVHDPYVEEGTPDHPALALEITGDASEGVTTGTSTSGLGDQTVANEVSQTIRDAVPAPTNVPEYLQAARNGVKELNDQMKAALEKVADIAKNNPGKVISANTKEYGPKDVNGVTWRLFIRKYTDVRYGFLLQAKATTADDSTYKLIMGGVLARNATDAAHRGRGTVGVNLDNLKAVDSTFKGQGKLLSAFSSTDIGKTLVYLLKDFTPDASAHDPVTAAFVGHKVSATGATAVRLATFVNIPNAGATPTDAKEFVILRARNVPGTGGRGDLLAAGGDIEQGVFYYGVSCWDAQQSEVFKALARCTARNLSSCTVISHTGDRSACAADLREDSLPPEAGDTTPEAGAPSVSDVPPLPTDVTDGTNQ